jgi:hypothetical protein
MIFVDFENINFDVSFGGSSPTWQCGESNHVD